MTPTLPAEARAAAGYQFPDGRQDPRQRAYCLPPTHSHLNLLPEVRDYALDLFAELGIPWHAGVLGGPSNHLLDSQVQCANALTAMVTDPSRLLRAFDEVLGIGEVLCIEPGRYLTFEYIGPLDFFGETPGGERTRGTRCTSVDAAFLHRSAEGVTELVLVEWKYTESYGPRESQPRSDAIRQQRYGAAFADSSGPIRSELVSFDALLGEPFYQLMRQQLLAHALEQRRAEGADRVRVVHVSPAANVAYWSSVHAPELRDLGQDVGTVWRRLLRQEDRFISLDSSVFWDPTVSSVEYELRYSDQVAYGADSLLRVLGIDAVGRAASHVSGGLVDLAEEVADRLDFHGSVELAHDGVELIAEGVGTGLTYPFPVRDLHALAEELSGADG